jgi:hypothetical protein
MYNVLQPDGTPYFARDVSYMRNMFMKSCAGVNIINFSSSLTFRHDKLECLAFAKYFYPL